jgi:DinB superfamily
MQHLQYPIGKFDYEKEIQNSEIAALIKEIEALPAQLKKVISELTAQQLEVPYREGGWKVKQVVHHLADSHMNALIRLQLTLTEDNPTIKPYREDLWAEQAYQKTLAVNSSIQILELVQARLVLIFSSMSLNDYDRIYTHPQYGRLFKLRQVLALYAWHGKHHLSHITKLIERNFDGLQ